MPASTALQETQLPALISRDILFGNPERTSPQLSPDGKYLAYLAPDEKDVLQVWLRTVGQQDDRIITADKKRGIHLYFWTFDGDQLIYLQDADGDENFHFYSVNIKSNIVRDLTAFQGVKAELVDCDPNFPEQILVGLNLDDREKFDVYRINLKNGAVEFDTENPGNVVGWIADQKFQIRVASASNPDGGFDLLFREAVDKARETIRHWGPDDEGYGVSFSADGETLYIIGNHYAKVQRLIALNLATRQETVIAEDAEYDVESVFIHPLTRVIQAVSFYKDKKHWQVLDQSIADDFEAIANIRPGEFEVISRDLADKTWLISYLTDDGPVYYYTYNRELKTSTLLFSNQPKLEGLPLAPIQLISYQTRNGLTIHGYLTTSYQVAV